MVLAKAVIVCFKAGIDRRRHHCHTRREAGPESHGS